MKILLICLAILFTCAILSYAQYGQDYENSDNRHFSLELLKERIAERPYALVISILLPILALAFGLGFTTFLILSALYFIYNIFFPVTGFIGEEVLGVITLFLIIKREML